MHAKSLARVFLATLTLTSWLAGIGCSTVLGIEDAEPFDGGEGGAFSGSGGSGGSGGSTDPCEDYCDTVLANCRGDHQVYTGRLVCLDLCRVLDEGSPGDDDNDTVRCRLRQAELAAADVTNEPGVHCPRAGLGGEGVCGTNCDALCRAIVNLCSEETPSFEACVADCLDVPDLGGFHTGLASGNSVQCRLYHVGAATQDPGTHCPHTVGVGPCAP